MSLAAKFIKATKVRGAGRLSELNKKATTQAVDTGIPALNLAFSGWLNKGPSYGITSLAGKSRSFKTMFGLVVCKAYMDANPDSFMIFYDSEGGASESYFDTIGIDTDRVIYIPIMNIEELKFDIMEKLSTIKKEVDETGKGNEFVWFIDSVGNLASIKEVTDALDQKSVADMTRAKALKSLFRMITPYFKNYGMKLIAIQHTYDEIGGMGAPKQIMSGGQGGMLSSDEVFIIGKRQIKDGSDLVGWQFILNAEKSRSIREKSAIPFEVTYEGGIDKFSGLLDIACVTGHVEKPKMGWYTRPSVENDKNWRKKETSTDEFWEPLLNDETFQKAVHDLYALGGNPILQGKIDNLLAENPEIDQETGEILNAENHLDV